MPLSRILISVLLLVHLYVVALLPSPYSYFTRTTRSFFEPYLDFFEFSGTWNFFAPEPGPPPLYLEWELQGAQGEDLGSGRFPESGDPFVFRDRQNRRIAIARFMHSGDDRYLRIWGSYVCRSDRRVSSIRLWKVALDVPRLQEVASGAKSIASPEVFERRSAGKAFCAEFHDAKAGGR